MNKEELFRETVESQKVHELLSLLVALEYHLKEAEKIRQEIGSNKNKLKDLRK